MFYTTNTESTITLDDVDITNAEDSEFFLKCTGNANQRGWGTTGANGADCLFTAIDQTMEGNVIWDSISDLDFYMTGESTLTGAVVQDESNAGWRRRRRLLQSLYRRKCNLDRDQATAP